MPPPGSTSGTSPGLHPPGSHRRGLAAHRCRVGEFLSRTNACRIAVVRDEVDRGEEDEVSGDDAPKEALGQ